MGDHKARRSRSQGLTHQSSDPSVDTIAAIATPLGRGGVGIVRVSGPGTRDIAQTLLGSLPIPRRAHYARFLDGSGQTLDQGIALYFSAPASFTGEDVLELHGHGGPIVMDLLLRRTLALGARLAEPGEFSRRALINDKLDLAQAEAVADLIDSQTQAAARSAMRSLSGEFSSRIHRLVEELVRLRTFVEAAIDFPEEEIDFLADDRLHAQLEEVIADVGRLLGQAHTGRLLRDGLTLVIAGLPNAGKSSLMNALTGQNSAIVTQIPGTTRDVLREQIEIDGLPLHIVDTAGLRESGDAVELAGVQRAREQIARADHALWVFDGAADPEAAGLPVAGLPPGLALTRIRNKIDLIDVPPGLRDHLGTPEICLSAKQGIGIERLREHLKGLVAYQGSGEGDFSARRRHVLAIELAQRALLAGRKALREGRAGELLAEDLREAQKALATITGEFAADDLLGEIFASFCIGK